MVSPIFGYHIIAQLVSKKFKYILNSNYEYNEEYFKINKCIINKKLLNLKNYKIKNNTVYFLIKKLIFQK